MATSLTIIPGTDVDVYQYVAGGVGGYDYVEGDVAQALKAEMGDQVNRCRVPVDEVGAPTWVAVPTLAEALCRRVAHNLALRKLPLGVQRTITEAAALNTYVGGTDAEVKRLEAPYRKLTVG